MAGRGSTRKARRHRRCDVAFARATRLRAFPPRPPGEYHACNQRAKSRFRPRGRPFVASATRVGLPRCDRSTVDTAWALQRANGRRRCDAQAARTAIEMVWQEEGLIVRCHSPSIEEDRHGREIEEASCAQPRFPGNRGKGADAQLEGKEAEEDVAREVACSGLQRSPDAAPQRKPARYETRSHPHPRQPRPRLAEAFLTPPR